MNNKKQLKTCFSKLITLQCVPAGVVVDMSVVVAAGDAPIFQQNVAASAL
jgi:hypothetical protein